MNILNLVEVEITPAGDEQMRLEIVTTDEELAGVCGVCGTDDEIFLRTDDPEQEYLCHRCAVRSLTLGLRLLLQRRGLKHLNHVLTVIDGGVRIDGWNAPTRAGNRQARRARMKGAM